MSGLLPSSSSRSTSSESSSSKSGINGHSELRVALIFPVSNSISIKEVSFLPMKYLSPCSCSVSEVNGDISTNSDIENGNRCKGLEGVDMTYISPD